MTDVRAELSPEPKKWWQDRAIVVGIIGVIATVVVGVVTYWLTAGTVSREYEERVKAAKNEVRIAVSRSIGEGVVPNKDKIQAVINSVERQYGIKPQDSESPEGVIDDIVERVLANEFLDAKRREELSTKLLDIKKEVQSIPQSQQSKQPVDTKNQVPREVALLTVLAMALATAFYVPRILKEGKDFSSIYRSLVTVLIMAGTILLITALLTLSPASQTFLKLFQK